MLNSQQGILVPRCPSPPIDVAGHRAEIPTQ